MQAQPKGDSAPGSKRNVIAGHIDPLKPIPLFEITQATARLLPVRKIRIYQSGDAAIGTRTHSLHDQSVRRRFVPITHEREDVHQSRLRSRVVHGQLYETD